MTMYLRYDMPYGGVFLARASWCDVREEDAARLDKLPIDRQVSIKEQVKIVAHSFVLTQPMGQC